MDLAKARLEERLMLIEEKMIACCDERSRISYELSQTEIDAHKSRFENRINELDLEIKLLWRVYRWLAGITV
jgi:hypothetical protein